jgi:hypothetical protein
MPESGTIDNNNLAMQMGKDKSEAAKEVTSQANAMMVQ